MDVISVGIHVHQSLLRWSPVKTRGRIMGNYSEGCPPEQFLGNTPQLFLQCSVSCQFLRRAHDHSNRHEISKCHVVLALAHIALSELQPARVSMPKRGPSARLARAGYSQVLPAEAIDGSTLALQRVDDVHRLMHQKWNPAQPPPPPAPARTAKVGPQKGVGSQRSLWLPSLHIPRK